MRVSLVVPLHNEERTIDRLLRSVLAQTRLPDELVCVNAGSTDGTAARLAAFASSIPLRVLERARLNPGEARNEGVRHATHDWIAFTDGGTELAANWLEELLKSAQPGIDVVFGSYEPVCDTSFRRWAAVAYVPARAREGIRGPFVASMVLSRRAFEAAGGFPPYRAAEDLVFLEKLQATQFRAAFVPGAVVRWETAATPRATLRRFATYSQANLAAGRGRFWHWGVFRQYFGIAALVLALAALDLPWAGALVVPAWFIARAAKAAWQKRRSFDFETLQPALVLGSAFLIVIVDAGTFLGLLRWLRHPRAKLLD
jgi:glycosyltransferase involved in cell wall biosynthesis